MIFKLKVVNQKY